MIHGSTGLAERKDTVHPFVVVSEYLAAKYLTIWRRQPGGEVRFLTDGGNARPSP